MYKIYYKDINDIELSDELEKKLSASRIAKLKALSREDDRKRCAAAGLLLWKYVYQEHPDDYEIILQKKGKPCLVPKNGTEPASFFSITHSRSLAVLAVDDYPIGCDIEFSDRAIGNIDLISKRILHPNERKLFYSLVNINRKNTAVSPTAEVKCINSIFLRFWTAKEAFLKATGDGLTVDCRTIDLSSGHLYANGIDWRLDCPSLENYPDYILSVCHRSCASPF